ncbi:UNVERIFIED_CONTAM: hypothetical protein FKN15_034093 [Acipenser sinensis]
MAARWQDVAAQQADVIASRLRELLSTGLGLLHSKLGVDLGLKPEQCPSWVLLMTVFLGLLVIVVVWVAACAGLCSRRKQGDRASDSGSQATKTSATKSVKGAEQKKKNKKKPVEKKQSNGRTILELQEDDIKDTNEILKKSEMKAEKQTKKNKKKTKAEVKPALYISSPGGKEPEDGAWETKISNREKKQQRRRDKVTEDSSLPGTQVVVATERPSSVVSFPIGLRKIKVSASWNEAPAVNGGGWNDMAMKLPTQMSGGDGETWTGITKAAAKRNPEPAWGQELEVLPLSFTTPVVLPLSFTTPVVLPLSFTTPVVLPLSFTTPVVLPLSFTTPVVLPLSFTTPVVLPLSFTTPVVLPLSFTTPVVLPLSFTTPVVLPLSFTTPVVLPLSFTTPVVLPLSFTTPVVLPLSFTTPVVLPLSFTTPVVLPLSFTTPVVLPLSFTTPVVLPLSFTTPVVLPLSFTTPVVLPLSFTTPVVLPLSFTTPVVLPLSFTTPVVLPPSFTTPVVLLPCFIPVVSDDEKKKVDSAAAAASGKSKKKKKKKKQQGEDVSAPVQETGEPEKVPSSELEVANSEPEMALPEEATRASEPVKVELKMERPVPVMTEPPVTVLDSTSKNITSQVPQRLPEPEPPVSTTKQSNVPPLSQSE